MKNKLKGFLYLIAKKSKFLRNFYRNISYWKNGNKYKKILANTVVCENLILFESFMGRSYSCSPKAIYEYLYNDKKYKNYKFIWIFKEVSNYAFLSNDRTRVVKYGSKEYFESYAKAKYWVCNSEIPIYIKKRKEQIFVQTWHGTPLKRLRCDIKIEGGGSAINSLEEIKKKNNLDAIRYDYFLSPSSFASDKFISAFNLKNLHKEDIILECGYPRNDFLFKFKKVDVDRIKKYFGIPKNKKVILYAPTFRDSDHNASSGYIYKLGIDFDQLKKRYSSEYVVLFRTHYFISNSFNFDNYKDFIYDASSYDDVNDLYIISDLLITDYSSVFFDFANLKKPILFYMYDLDKYKNKMRDFYFDLDELPGPVILNQDELHKELDNIESYDNRFNKKYALFNKKFNYLDDDSSSKRVVEEFICQK